MHDILYLDYAATTPVDPLVSEAMWPFFTETFANPSSIHRLGQKARKAVETAREQVAFALGAKAKEIVFTSGSTEAINQAIRGVAALYPGKHILTSQLEHAATLGTCHFLETQGHPVSYVAPNAAGEITLEAVQAALRPDTCLVALMLVNNETGVLTDISAISNALKGSGVLFFCDAVQAFGFEPVNVQNLGVDLLCISGHKAYGPKGIAALFMREGLELPPLMLGGEQERGLRAGTHNSAAIVGMGQAATLVTERQVGDYDYLLSLKQYFEQALGKLEDVTINAVQASRSIKHINVQVKDVDGEALLMNLDALGICASAGSACAAGSVEPSHVLLAMGLHPAAAKASIRFSIGRGITQAMLQDATNRVSEAIQRCRVYA